MPTNLFAAAPIAEIIKLQQNHFINHKVYF